MTDTRTKTTDNASEFVRATNYDTESDGCYADRSECYGPTADLRPCSLCTEIRSRGDALEARGEL